MHILILSWRDVKNPLSGGAESFLHELSKRLVKRGHKVTLFTSSFPGAKPQEKLEGIQIYRQGYQWTVHLNAFRWYRKQPQNSFDLIIDNFHALPFFTPLYSKQPIIGVIHEITHELWFAETFFPINLIGYLLEPLFFLPYRNRHFLVASPSTKKNLVSFGHPEDQITVFFQGIDMKAAKKMPRKAKFPLIICLSRLSPTKRFEHAIIAMSTIAKKVPSAQLWIAGSGKPDYLEKLKKLVDKYDLAENVRFLGFTTGKDKIKLLKKAWLILGTSIREGWGLAITEAAAFATPAVTYDVPGFKDSVIDGKTGVLVEASNPQKLANAVVNLILDNKKRRKLGLKALKRTKGKTREKTLKQLLPLFLRTASQQHRPKDNKLNILIISWRDIKSPAAGGAEILTHEIAKRLTRWGHKVTIMAPIFPKASKIEKVDGVKILRPSFFFVTRPITYLNWPRFLLNAAATYKQQLANQVDIVIDQVHGLPSFTPFFVKKPIILFPLEVANEIWLTEIPFPGNILGWFVERTYLLLFRNFPFLTISPSTKKDLLQFSIKRIKTITPGVTKPQKKLPQKNQYPTFICLGRITKMKRLKDSIQAFFIFQNTHPKSKLYIVGKGTHLEELKDFVKELRLNHAVKFHGFVSEKQKYELLSCSWALLSTSLREGWGLNVIEAASVGTPTIAYKIPGIVDTVVDKRTGLLTESNNPATLALSMNNFVNNKNLRNRLSYNAKNHAKQFNWDKSAKQFIKAIRGLKKESW